MNRVRAIELQLLHRRVKELEQDVERYRRRIEMWQKILNEWKRIATQEQIDRYYRFFFRG
jgi:hypothetical protein